MSKRLVRKETDRAVLTEDQIEDLKLAFEMFDEKEQGFLTKADLQIVCDKYAIKAGASAVADMFKEADVTNQGKIGFPEFMSMMTRKMKETDSEDELTEAFRVFDPYGDGVIPEKELTDALTKQGDKLTREELDEMYSICLVDGNVNYKTFVTQMYSNK
jgi:calmodulin